MRNNNINLLFEKLNEFIKKYHKNQLIKGGIYVVSILVVFFLLFAIIEHYSSFGVKGRTFLFWTYILLNLLVFGKLVMMPLLHLLNLGKTLNYKRAAKIIGKHFPEIDDKLTNVLELVEISKIDSNLITASIDQKTKKLSPISFKSAVDFTVNRKHIKWVLIPVMIVFLFILSGKEYMLSESSARIIQHNTFFEPKAPFSYLFLNDQLHCKQFESFLLKIKIEGNQIPEEVYVKYGQNTYKLNGLGNHDFEYLFKRVHADINFQLYAGGYLSKGYQLKSLLQPKVVDMNIHITYPKYINKKPTIIKNTGDLIVNIGSTVNWNIQLEHSDNCVFVINNKEKGRSTKNNLIIQSQLFSSTSYSIISSNSNNLCDTLTYFITVLPDEFPKITLTQSYDTINSKHLFNGIVEDDFLVQKLEFIYSYPYSDSTIYYTEEIFIDQKSLEQFFHEINFSLLEIGPGKEISYFFKVWDNDGVNGSKFTKSKTFKYKEPSISDLVTQKNIENEKTKLGLNKSISLAKEIKREIEALNKSVLEKKKIGWEEKQKAKEILKKQKELEKQIQDTQKKNSENQKRNEKLNSSILEKQKKLEELMNNILDEEMKQLLKEMEETMDDTNKEELRDLLEKLDQENTDLEKELDRELELFKALELEQKIEETLEKISELKEQQQKLKTETESKKANKKELAHKQDSLNNIMQEIRKDLQEIKEKNMDLEDKKEIPETEKLEERIEGHMQKSKDDLEKGNKKKSQKSQEDAIQEMEKLEDELQNMQETDAESQPVEDMESLRKILENLITLSFDQEELMGQLENTPRNSPDFIKLVQKQNKLSEDSKIVEDSLFALSKRVLQIQSTINQEISAIKSNMIKATKELENRDINRASERQQFVMTSVNNLALLLSETLEQMQKQLDMLPSQCKKPKNCNKPNPNCNKPSMSQLKKAQKNLNDQMKKCKRDGEGKKNKTGKKQREGKSKELMKLAKKQAEIRQQLMELRDEIGENGGKGNIDKILEEMEENERDIINNQITQETINRQQEILTRLLESEKAEREEEEDNKRQSTEWDFSSPIESQEFIKYRKQKKAQEELLKTTPLQLTPFYKKKVAGYFNSYIND